jgi:hypothetical protein
MTTLAAAILLPGMAGATTLGAFVVASGVGVATFRASGSGGPASGRSVALGAAVGLVVGFLLGFIGPMLLDPTGAQGPMLGLFVTGPLGLLIGTAVALLRERLRRD